MAADLGSTPHSGLTVQLCGDAHLSNFGFYSTPERNQAFDINDFDETYPGPFEWDVKRLAASVAVASLVEWLLRGRRPAAAALDTVSGLPAGDPPARSVGQPGRLVLAPGHDRAAAGDPQAGRPSAPSGNLSAGLAKARYRDSNDALRKLCVTVDGQVQIKNDPPLIMPGEELLGRLGRGRRTPGTRSITVADRGLPGGPAERSSAPVRPVHASSSSASRWSASAASAPAPTSC